MLDFERAKDKILMGAERRSMVMSEKDKEMTAYHEAGHTIVGLLSPGYDPIYKVTIIPRGRALGVTMSLPEEDKLSVSQEYLNSSIAMAFGGRVAEGLIYGDDKISTGASNDIKQASSRARSMVTKWGFSEDLGPILYSEDEDEVFLGRSVTHHKNVSDDTAMKIDNEVRKIIDRNYKRAEKILTDNMDILHAMSAALMKYETLDADQISDLMERREPRPPKDWNDDVSSSSNTPTNTESKTPASKDVGKKGKADGNMGNPAGEH